MEEKIIIKSKVANVKLVRNIIWIVGVISGVLAAMLYAESRRFSYVRVSKWDDGIYDIQEYLGEMFSIYGILCFIGVIAVAFIAGYIFYRATSKIALTVTDKRVYGTAAWGMRVDLPFDMISAVGTSAFKGIAVTTSSGAIKFIMMENRDKIHDAISKQLVIRQSDKKRDTVIKQEIPHSNAEELRKYKELLDLGVITQDEFDAKKKQLLGL
jgi:hypothetical protein